VHPTPHPLTHALTHSLAHSPTRRPKKALRTLADAAAPLGVRVLGFGMHPLSTPSVEVGLLIAY
jgi:hypothetical protein